ncbi:MAG: hypothetical protein ACYCVD_00260 [Desulfitobacteriaceae bacterium]
MEQEIRIRTSADLTGAQAVQKHLEAIKDLANQISKNGVQFGVFRIKNRIFSKKG